MSKAPSGTSGRGKYRMRVDSGVHVAMRDGIRIALRVYRPDADGRFPVLFAASPYMYATDDIPHSTMFLWREVGPVEWYVRDQGYAYVHMDVRGSGKSGGDYDFLGPIEQNDFCEVIEWIGRQSWSNGNVGGIGQSYYAMAQWLMAVRNPPSLKCIAPYDGAVDLYRDQVYHGGIYGEFMAWWYNMVRLNNLHRASSDPTGRDMPIDLAHQLMSHQTYDDWWKERNAFEGIDQVTIPVLSIGHWGKMGLHLRGNIIGYEALRGPRKLIVTGARDVFEAHDLFDRVDYHQEQLLPFYDRYLKGIDNGYENKADVRIYVRGEEQYRDEEAWPLKRARYRPYYLNGGKSASLTSLNDGGLSTEAPKRGGGNTVHDYPNAAWKLGVVAMGPQGPDPVRGVLTFTSPPLDDDLEVTGPVILELYAASTATDTDFIVRIADQFPRSDADRERGLQPTAVNVSKGWLRASHRQKDETRSRPHRPFYTHRDPQPIVPGEVVKYQVEMMPFSNLFKKGHRIRLEITNGDSMLTDSFFVHQYLWYKVGRDSFFHNTKYPSRLLLPIITRKKRREARS